MGVDLIKPGSGQGAAAGPCGHGDKHLDKIKLGEFLDQFSNHQAALCSLYRFSHVWFIRLQSGYKHLRWHSDE